MFYFDSKQSFCGCLWSGMKAYIFFNCSHLRSSWGHSKLTLLGTIAVPPLWHDCCLYCHRLCLCLSVTLSVVYLLQCFVTPAVLKYVCLCPCCIYVVITHNIYTLFIIIIIRRLYTKFIFTLFGFHPQFNIQNLTYNAGFWLNKGVLKLICLLNLIFDFLNSFQVTCCAFNSFKIKRKKCILTVFKLWHELIGGKP